MICRCLLSTALVLNATPGVDMLFTLSRTLQHGWRTGMAAALGITAGCVVHTVAAALGLAALLATSALAFTAIKWLGAAYLLWLAWACCARRCATRRHSLRVSSPTTINACFRARIFDQRAESESRSVLSRPVAAIHFGRCAEQDSRVLVSRRGISSPAARSFYSRWSHLRIGCGRSAQAA